MKHNLKITFILLSMFLVTQFIGLAVLHADPLKIEANIDGEIQEVTNPYLTWIDPPEPETQTEFSLYFGQLLIAFAIAIALVFFLMKFKIKLFFRIWFFTVITIALFLTFLAFEKLMPWMITIETAVIVAALIAIPLAYIKIFKQNFLIHNFTELLVYPGIASVFVPILNLLWIIILLILISIYDMWAVWHSGIMQKMAKYHIDTLKIFPGFFVPHLSKSQKIQIKNMKKSDLKKKKFKVNVAILGGGDVIFPIIAAGVVMKTFSEHVFLGIEGLLPALFVTAGATLGLAYLFFTAEKKKFYPAMPFISAGIFAGMLLAWAIF